MKSSTLRAQSTVELSPTHDGVIWGPTHDDVTWGATPPTKSNDTVTNATSREPEESPGLSLGAVIGIGVSCAMVAVGVVGTAIAWCIFCTNVKVEPVPGDSNLGGGVKKGLGQSRNNGDFTDIGGNETRRFVMTETSPGV